MRYLFVTGHKYLPQMYGGLQTSTDEFCRSLMQRGHHVSVMAGLMPGGAFAFKARVKMFINKLLFGQSMCKSTVLGYPVWFSWKPWEQVGAVIAKEKPDLVIVMSIEAVRMAAAVRNVDVPMLLQLMDVEFRDHGGDFAALGNPPCLVNSQFTADKYREAYGVHSTIVYPFIAPEKYTTATTRENVTFINPVKEKGVEIALQVAQLCPDIPFVFVEGWPLTVPEREALLARLRHLPNVTLLPSQKDMRNVYGKCKIALVPSLWEEAYGRIATEAQMSGIPVVASRIGGLPEAVGNGGLLVEPAAPIVAWVQAIRALWDDAERYAAVSAAAHAYAHREEMTLAYQINAMEKVLLDAAKPQSSLR